jgi:hypothetical protein
MDEWIGTQNVDEWIINMRVGRKMYKIKIMVYIMCEKSQG